MTVLFRAMRWVSPASLMVLLAGCANLASSPSVSAVFDLGRGDVTPPTARIVPATIEVRAPSWLSSSAMQYRLDYIAPAAREAYTGSRWAGQPVEMIQRFLSTTMSAAVGETGNCRLHIELDEFVQSFESVEHSHAEMAVRAALIGARNGAVIAWQTFAIRMPAPTADARGGVQAHRAGVAELVDQLRAWLDLLDAGEDRVGVCRREQN